MSVSASIDLKLHFKDNKVFSCIDVINAMIDKGWTIKRNDKICYLPVGDNDLYEWKEEDFSKINIEEVVKQKEILHEIIGINIYWGNSDIGLSVLIFDSTEISFNISINPIKINLPQMDIADVNWYLGKILPCFTNNMVVRRITFNQD